MATQYSVPILKEAMAYLHLLEAIVYLLENVTFMDHYYSLPVGALWEGNARSQLNQVSFLYYYFGTGIVYG